MKEKSRILWIYVVSATTLLAGLIMSCQSVRTAPNDVRHLLRRTSDLQELYIMAVSLQDDRQAIDIYEALSTKKLLPLSSLAERMFTDSRPEIHERAAIPAAGGWLVRRMDVVFNEVELSRLGRFVLFAEQQPLALAYFVYGQGDPHKTVLTAVKGGRDADSIACNSAAWLGALHGISVWPKKWRDTVQQANLKRMNLKQCARKLIARGLENGTVRLDLM